MKTILVTANTYEDTSYKVNQDYLTYAKTGGNPITISPETDVLSLLQVLEEPVLFLTGGVDISPNLFGEENYNAYNVCEERDAFELSLLAHALKNNLPVFGICRGFQLMFKFLQNYGLVPEYLNFSQHISGHNQADQNIKGKYTFHKTFYRSDFSGNPYVNSFHHQGVVTANLDKRYTPFGDFTPVCYSFGEKRIDVLEAFLYRNWRAVQWHPERLPNDHTFKNYVEML